MRIADLRLDRSPSMRRDLHPIRGSAKRVLASIEHLLDPLSHIVRRTISNHAGLRGPRAIKTR